MEDDVGLVSIEDAYSRRFHAGEFHKIEIVFNLAFGDLLWGERNAEVVKVSSIGRSEGESKPSARPATLRPKRPPGSATFSVGCTRFVRWPATGVDDAEDGQRDIGTGPPSAWTPGKLDPNGSDSA